MIQHNMSRRALLLAGAAALTGCSTNSGAGPRTRNGASGSRSKPAPSLAPPPTPALYEAPAGDALPNFKRAAGRFAQALATYDAAKGALPPVSSDIYLGTSQDLAMAAAPLRAPARWSRADVEFVQYGGLTPVSPQATSGVAMVVLRQVLHEDTGQTTVVRRTLDIRLRQESGTWRIEALASAGGARVERPQQLPGSAQRVLDDARIDLPDSARWDIYSGQIAEDLLRVMLRLADVTRFRSTVLKTGHPERVVDGRAAAPVSAHWRGRAVDIHSLDDVPLAESAPPLIRSMMQTAGSIASVSQVGGPQGFDFDGGGRRYFTNLVHADHLHVAVRGTAA